MSLSEPENGLIILLETGKLALRQKLQIASESFVKQVSK